MAKTVTNHLKADVNGRSETAGARFFSFWSQRLISVSCRTKSQWPTGCWNIERKRYSLRCNRVHWLKWFGLILLVTWGNFHHFILLASCYSSRMDFFANSLSLSLSLLASTRNCVGWSRATRLIQSRIRLLVHLRTECRKENVFYTIVASLSTSGGWDREKERERKKMTLDRTINAHYCHSKLKR